MYDIAPATRLRPRYTILAIATALLLASGASAQIIQQDASLIRKITGPTDKLEISTNTSRILTLETRIPRVQVNNPELLSVTALSATQIQVSAKKAGVTAINLWDEEGNIHTVDVYIYGDVKELQHALKTQFPHSSVQVYRYSNSLVLAGFIDRPDYVTPIVEMAQDYSPKVINNMSVGGVQQVLLKVKLYEVSRTKLRRLGVDWAYQGANGGFALNSVNDILSLDGGIVTSNLDTFAFGVIRKGHSFITMMDALQERRVAKVMAEPNLVAISGRPAKFISGGEIAYLVAQGGVGQTTFTTEFREFGTIVDFMPIVLGNGNIRLEVRPEVKAPDDSLGTVSSGVRIPGFRKRYVETAVEMKAGQTFAIAGLVDERVTAVNRGLPVVSNIPYLGVPFRKMEDEIEEIELLIMVTPELVDPINADEVPQCYPGSGTISPDCKELYLEGLVEVPNPCSPCGGYPYVPTHGHVPCCPNGGGCLNGQCGDGSCGSGFDAPVQGYEGQGYESQSYEGGYQQAYPQQYEGTPYSEGFEPTPVELPEPLPAGGAPSGRHGELMLPPDAGAANPTDRVQGPALDRNGRAMSDLSRRPSQHYTASRSPQYRRQPSQPFNRQSSRDEGAQRAGSSGLIGPVGYDLE